MTKAADLARELRDVAVEYGDWLQDTAEKGEESMTPPEPAR